MVAAYVDRVWETSTTTGTGAIALGGAKTGYQAFSASVDDTDTCYFVIEAVDGNGVPTGQWEIQNNTYNSGSNTLSRSAPNVINGSSGVGTLVNFSAGTKNVFLAITAETFITRDGTFSFTGIQSMGNNRLNNVAAPSAGQDAANKDYVDTAVAALAPKDDCQAATVIALAASTYNNGSSGVGATLTANAAAVLIIDGYTVALGNRLLIKNQADAKQNGLYSVTTLGTVVVPSVLTRTTDFNQPGDGLNGALVYILNGTTNANTLWSNTNGANITFGTSNINWIQFTGTTYTADETTLHLSGTTFSIISTYTGQTSIVTLGTITTGTWHGTVVGVQYGGSGANLSATGGTGQYVKQASAGAVFTVSVIPVADLPALDGFTEADWALTDEVVKSSSGHVNQWETVQRLGGFVDPGICNGRLTLTTAVAVTTSDVTGATTIYFTPYLGARISIYDGTRWKLYALSEVNLAVGTLVNAQGYDVYIYDNSGTLTLEFAEWANATITCTSASPGVVTWTGHGMSTTNSVTFTNSGGALPTGISANVQYFITKVDANTFKISTSLANVAAGTFVNTSSTGTGTHTGHQPQARQTALVLQDGVLCKTGTLTRRYLGSFLTTATTTTEDSVAKRWLFNAYNQAPRTLLVQVTNTSATYASATWGIYTGTLFQTSFFLGLAEKQIAASAWGCCQGTSTNGYVGIGLNRTNGSDAQVMSGGGTSASLIPLGATYDGVPAIGYNALIILEACQAASTVTFYGTGGFTNQLQAGLRGSIWA